MNILIYRGFTFDYEKELSCFVAQNGTLISDNSLNCCFKFTSWEANSFDGNGV